MKARTGSPDVSLVIPFLNEVESLEELHHQIGTVMAGIRRSFEIIFIDDGSTDGSVDIVERLSRRDRRVRLIQFLRNYGKAAALDAGFVAATGRYVVTMDADLQDDPAEIPRLLEKLESGYDLVSGWKKVRHDPLGKRIASKVYNLFTSLFSGIRLHDFNCGLKIYRSEVVKTMRVYGELHRYLPVIAFRNGYRVGELAVQHHPRKYGKSKYGVARFARGAFDLMTITFLTRYKMRPLHLFGLIGGLCFLSGLGLSSWLVYERIFAQKYLSNRPLLFLGVLLIIVGIQFFSIGLLGEMIASLRRNQDTYQIKRCIGCAEPNQAQMENRNSFPL
jgi:glycosyltransferase involved in cell wall biosynthesis